MGVVPYSSLIHGVLQEEFAPLRHARKLLARKGGVSPRTAENWLSGACAPQGEQLLSLMAECDRLSAAILAEVERRKRA